MKTALGPTGQLCVDYVHAFPDKSSRTKTLKLLTFRGERLVASLGEQDLLEEVDHRTGSDEALFRRKLVEVGEVHLERVVGRRVGAETHQLRQDVPQSHACNGLHIGLTSTAKLNVKQQN